MNRLEPAELFKSAAASVYAVLAAPSRQQLLAGENISQGSAVAVSGDELITNCHVVDGAGFIALVQGEHVGTAQLIKASPDSDRCVIRAASILVTAAKGIRRFPDLSVGERVYTIGTPSGLEQTLGEGLISGLRESGGVKLIQTSAPIPPGSSGGGLF